MRPWNEPHKIVSSNSHTPYYEPGRIRVSTAQSIGDPYDTISTDFSEPIRVNRISAVTQTTGPRETIANLHRWIKWAHTSHSQLLRLTNNLSSRNHRRFSSLNEMSPYDNIVMRPCSQEQERAIPVYTFPLKSEYYDTIGSFPPWVKCALRIIPVPTVPSRSDPCYTIGGDSNEAIQAIRISTVPLTTDPRETIGILHPWIKWVHTSHSHLYRHTSNLSSLCHQHFWLLNQIGQYELFARLCIIKKWRKRYHRHRFYWAHMTNPYNPLVCAVLLKNGHYDTIGTNSDEPTNHWHSHLFFIFLYLTYIPGHVSKTTTGLP